MSTFEHVSSEEHIAEVARLARDIWNDHYVPIIGQEQVDYMLEKFQSKDAISEQISNSHEYYLVREDGAALGYFAVVPQPNQDRMMLSKIYLQRSARGRGLGQKMLRFVENLCRERNISSIRLRVNKDNADSIEWYRRQGFEKIAAPVKDIGEGFVMDDYKMEKNVGR